MGRGATGTVSTACVNLGTRLMCLGKNCSGGRQEETSSTEGPRTAPSYENSQNDKNHKAIALSLQQSIGRGC